MGIKILQTFQAALVFLCFAAYSSQNIISYNLEYSSKNETNLEVRFQSYLDQDGNYTLLFPIGVVTYSIKAQNKDTRITSDESRRVWKICGQPGERLDVKYKFYLPNPNRSVLWPVIDRRYIISNFEKLLATPQHQLNEIWKININTSNLPREFVVHSSFSNNIRNISLEMPITKFNNGLLVAGNLNIHNIKINKKQTRLVLLNQVNSLSKDASFCVETLIKAQRAFWKDNDFEDYLIVLDERTSDIKVPGPAGTHLENSLFLQFVNFGNEYNYKNIYALSHELFHAWIGKKIAFGPSQDTLQWFVEGVNDYYGLWFAYENKLISTKEYIMAFNELLLRYYLNPVNHFSNDVISKNYQKDPFVNKMAEMRGHLFAKKVAEKKGEILSLITHEIFNNFQKSGKKYVHQGDVDKIFRKHLPRKFWHDYIKYIYNGDFIEPFDKDFLGCKLINETYEVPDLGFNILDLIIKKTISGIDPLSPEYAAGLRNNQKVKAHTISLISSGHMSIWIEEDNTIREISFVPNIRKTVVPQYNLCDL